jgi:plasmid stability protein
VEKTTVYLTTDVKRRLKSRAERTGRSEAHMIREALEAYLVDEPRALPKSIGSIELNLPEGVDSSNIKSWIRENWIKDIEEKRSRHEAELKARGQTRL